MKSINLDWKLTKPQLDFINSKKKYRLFLGGVGSGKTAVGCMASIMHMLKNPNSLGIIITQNFAGIREVIWRELDHWMPEELIADWNNNRMYMELINGSTVLFRSASDARSIDRLRGLTLSWGWIDECTYVPEETWDVVLSRLRQSNVELRAWMTGTPKMNWVYEKFINRDELPPEFHILQHIPTFSNKYLPPEYIESLKQQYSGQYFRQEILGEFVAFEGLVFMLTDQNKMDAAHCDAIEFDKIMYGLDFGFVNPTALVTIGKKGDSYYLIDEVYDTGLNDADVIERCKNMYQKHGRGPIWCDPSSPGTIIEMKRHGLDARKANNDVISGIKRMITLIAYPRFFVSRRCVNTLNEFNMYVWNDKVTKDIPVKANDHIPDATRYAVYSDSIGRQVFVGGI